MSSQLSGSQMSPPSVPAIERDGVRYEQDVDRQRRDDVTRAGWLVARDATTGQKLWDAKIYDNPSDPKSPTGSPEIRFARMRFVDGAETLVIEDTVGGRYQVDLRTREVTRIGGPSTATPTVKPDNRPNFD
jgi:hypothetical protein